jgi:hypothetical protein
LPLTELLRKTQPYKVQWNNDWKSLTSIDRCTIVRSESACAWPWQPYLLFTDASFGTIGAWTAKYDIAGPSRPIALAGKMLTGSQINCLLVQKALYTVAWRAQHFYQYFYGNEIHLYSDHRPLQWLHTLSYHSQRLARWSLLMQNLNLIPHYVKSVQNVVAGCLSRL